MTSSLEPRSSHDWRDVGRLEEIQKIRGSSRTSRLVWVSATLYGDGVRRRCATRCPRPLVDSLATQCPRLRRLSGSPPHLARKRKRWPLLRGATVSFSGDAPRSRPLWASTPGSPG